MLQLYSSISAINSAVVRVESKHFSSTVVTVESMNFNNAVVTVESKHFSSAVWPPAPVSQGEVSHWFVSMFVPAL